MQSNGNQPLQFECMWFSDDQFWCNTNCWWRNFSFYNPVETSLLSSTMLLLALLKSQSRPLHEVASKRSNFVLSRNSDRIKVCTYVMFERFWPHQLEKLAIRQLAIFSSLCTGFGLLLMFLSAISSIVLKCFILHGSGLTR